ncbi:MAG: hypothetical protein ABFD97_20375 [Syntrophobacter sp.]
MHDVIIETVDFHKAEPSDVMLGAEAHRILSRHYPEHEWYVGVDSEGGMMLIFALNISSRWGYRLKLARVYMDPDLKCVMRAGGEILERAAMVRGRWDEDQPPTFIEGVRRQDQPFNGIII